LADVAARRDIGEPESLAQSALTLSPPELDVLPLLTMCRVRLPANKRGWIMSTIDEPYIAVLQAVVNGEMVMYGDPKVFPSSTSLEEVKTEALRWAAELHGQVGKTATMILKQGSKVINSHTFKDE
jgi:hypothetical protein